MIKAYAKRLFWAVASSDNMLIRRPAWRLLRLFESIMKTAQGPSSADYSGLSDRDDDVLKRDRLNQLYEDTTSRSEALVPPPDLSEGKVIQIASSQLACMVILLPSLPKLDRTSSGLRIHHLLQAFSKRFEKIHLVYQGMSEDDPVYKRTFPGNVTCYHVPSLNSASATSIALLEPDILFVTDLFDLRYIDNCSRIVEMVKSNRAGCSLILDTMDCHWKKYVRKARLSGHQKDWDLAWRYLDLETQIYPRADLLTVVTTEDGEDVAFSIPESPPTAVLPNCYTLSGNPPRFPDTSGLCFVGPATVNHNLDAMRYLRDEILPFLLRLDQQIEISVIGSGWKQYLPEFAGLPFEFRGHVSDLDAALSKCRVFVCPLTYGAGLKGKLGSAASAGIPAVSTGVGAEGYPITTDQECYVSDDPEVFANHCNVLLNDPALWLLKRDQLRNMMEKNYGTNALERYVADVIRTGLTACAGLR